MRNGSLSWLGACLGALLLVGCNKDKPAPQAVEQPAAAKPAPKAAEPVPASPTVEDTTFKLALATDPTYAAGAPAKAQVVLEARGGYHVNQEYPIRIELKAPDGVKLSKRALEKADAQAFGEKSARFDVPFSADKGAHKLIAEVDFAVCTDETCVPDQRTLAAVLNVE